MAFKSKTRNRIAIAILFISLVAIIVTGFGTGGFGGLGSLTRGPSGDGSEALATIDGHKLTAGDVTDLVNRQFSQARQQNPNLTMAAFLAQGAFDEILKQMITQQAVQSFAGRQGMIVSQTMVDREIANIPAFRSLTGQFDQNVFQQQLRALNLTEAKLREDITQSLIQRQLLGPIALGTRVPESVAREYANLLLERRQGTVAVVPQSLMHPAINPTDAEIAAFYRANQVRFMIPERRVIKYAVIGLEQVPAATATEAEIAAVYRNSPRSYGAHETRNLQSIVLPTQQAADAFAQRVRTGTSFIAAAQQAGFAASDVTFTNQSREQFARVTSAPVAAAAFGGAQGAVVGPIRSELGFHVVRVDQVTTTTARPLEQVRGEIAAAIEQRKRSGGLATLISQIQDQISDGSSFEEVARAHNLPIVTTPPVTAGGIAVGGPPWTAPADLQPLLRAAFDIDPENPQASVEQITPNARFALLGMDRAIPAAAPPLAQIVQDVRAAYIERKALENARALADRIAQRVNSGTPIAQALAEAQPRLPTARRVDMRRLDISHSGQRVPPPLIALFSIPQGRARVLPAENNAGFFIVVHEARTAGDASTNAQLIQTTRTEFNSSVNEELAQQFARAIEARSEISRDEDAIRRARQALAGNASAATQ